MMTKLVLLSKKNKFFNILVRAFVWFSMKVINGWYEITGSLRVNNVLNNKYKDIYEMRNKYNGKRCFIICTGPSLRVSDLEMIKDEYTFGMNSICLLAEKTEFRPTFYGCNDLGVFKKLKNKIESYCENQTEVFVSDRISRNCSIKKGWHVFPENVAYHTYDRWFKEDFWCKFSNDCYRVVYGMHSITHSLIQIASYMGFKEIYLLGADCNQRAGKQIHFEEYGVPDTTLDTARERNICGYEEIKRYCDRHDVTVYNATRGGELEVFERKNLEEILSY